MWFFINVFTLKDVGCISFPQTTDLPLPVYSQCYLGFFFRDRVSSGLVTSSVVVLLLGFPFRFPS